MGLMKDADPPFLTVAGTSPASVTTPDSGDYRVHVDPADGALKLKDDTGTDYQVGDFPGYAEPTVVLADSPDEGVLDTVLRSDATIVAFSSTVPVTGTFGATGTAGSAKSASKEDHDHPWPEQQTAIANTSGLNVGDLELEVNKVKDALRAVGLIAT